MKLKDTDLHSWNLKKKYNYQINSKMNKEIKKSTRFLASKEDLANTKTEMIKWLVGLFFALALMIIGLYFK